MWVFLYMGKKIREQDIVKYRKMLLNTCTIEAQMVLVRTTVIIILHFIQDWPSPVIDLSQLQRIIWLYSVKFIMIGKNYSQNYSDADCLIS